MHKFKELKICAKAADLAVEDYKRTTNFYAKEKYGLISQMRIRSLPEPSNILVGAGRNTNGEFRQFLGIANVSFFKIETQLRL